MSVFSFNARSMITACLALAFGAATSTAAPLPAFPGAEGYGATATGGRGGTVYHVTTLVDSGPGSFRDAVSQPNRTVVFGVGGVINLSSDVEVMDNITIAGQTAPGQGISTYGATVYLNHGFGTTNSFGRSNIVIRYLRFRQGYDQTGSGYSLALKPAHTVMLDHCSIEVGNWQTLSITYNESTGEQPTDITVQNSIVGASVWHQLGALSWSPVNLTWHHNLFIDNAGRDPKAWGNMQIINDVVYNFRLGIYGDGGETVDFIGNYQINGPGSNANSVNTGVNVNGTNAGTYYLNGNYWDNNLNGKLDGVPLTAGSGSFAPKVSPTQICYPTIPVTVDSAALAFHKVVSQAGCSLSRDSLDAELISQAQSLGARGPGAGLYMGNTDPTNSWTGDPIPAWTIAGGSAPADSDGDGMPDEWELAVGSNYQVADNNVVDANGYTKLENYLNWLAAPHLKTCKNITAVDYDLWPLTVTFTNQTPVYVLSKTTNGTVMLVSNHWARFVPTTNFTGLGSFTFTVTATNGPAMTNLVGVLITPLWPPTNLVWRGDAVANAWNLYLTNDWFNGSTLQPFNGDDNVIFNDTGSNSLPVGIAGQLSPASVTVNATKNYTFGGSGSLVGNFVLTKTNSGTLILTNAHSFTGGIVVNGGTLLLTNNANASGAGTITLNGGTLNEATVNITNTIFNMGTNTWTISGSGNVQPGAALTGGGKLILNPVCSGQFTPTGDWSDFAGIIAWAPGNGASCRFYGTLGSSNAAFDLGTSTGKIFNRNGGITVQLGSLTGGPSTAISGASTYANLTTYVIGALNTDSTFNGKITDDSSGDTALIKVGAGTLTLTGSNTFSGGTTISNGTLRVDGTLFTNTVTVAGGALSGRGVISGPVFVQAGGTLAPGSGGVGILTVSSKVTLNPGCATIMELNKAAQTNDVLIVRSNLVLNGSLTVTNLAGALTAGDSFKLFSAASFSSNFSSLNLPVLANGLIWKTNTMPTNGTLSILSIVPRITTLTRSGTNFAFVGTNGQSSANYYLLGATNLTLPLTNWTRLATNQFDPLGNFRLTNSATTGKPRQFFILQAP